jgi:RNA polymerase sigma factor (sigma-70 family)
LTEQQINDLIEEYKPIVGGVIKKYKYFYLDDYDDVFQHGLIGLWYGITHYDDSKNTKLSTFLHTSVHSRISDVYKSTKKRREIENATVSYDGFVSNTSTDEMDVDSQIGVIVSSHVNPSNILDKIIYEKVVSDISKESDDKLRRMVLMYYVHQMGYQEIANILGCTRQNIESRIKTYIKKYRITLNKNGYMD